MGRLPGERREREDIADEGAEQLVGAILAAFWVQHLGPEMLDLIDHCQGLHPQARERRGPALDHKIKLGVHHVEKAVQLGVRLLALKAVERAGTVNRGPGRDGGRGAWAAQSVEREAIS